MHSFPAAQPKLSLALVGAEGSTCIESEGAEGENWVQGRSREKRGGGGETPGPGIAAK